ncbi:MAG: Histidinol dehydrogenase, partial [Candidatus Magnetoglobus multicellularis str. Araruama]
MQQVRPILADVKTKGDAALIEYTQKFDQITLTQDTIRVSEQEITEALAATSSAYQASVKRAISNLQRYHEKQRPKNYEIDFPYGGGYLGRKWEPLESVGLYVPGGRAPYLTACYMLGVPAQLAGCKRRVMCVPPERKSGKVNPQILVSAALSGISEIYKIGGAQAIGAMAYGTETIKPVRKIFGPGNVYVTAAKLLTFGVVDIDMPAGPSEALIIADESANPAYVAADLMSQAEHDLESAALLVTTDASLVPKVKAEIERQISTLKRAEIIKQALTKFGAIIVCPDLEVAVEIANDYAPEHIQILTKNPRPLAAQIKNSWHCLYWECHSHCER